MDSLPAAAASEGALSVWQVLRSPDLWAESLVARSLVVLLVYVALMLVLRLAILPRIADLTLRYSVQKTGRYLLNGLLLLALLALWMGDRIEISDGPSGDIIDVRLIMFSMAARGPRADRAQTPACRHSERSYLP